MILIVIFCLLLLFGVFVFALASSAREASDASDREYEILKGHKNSKEENEED
jgi:hypothetical protein